MFKLPNGRQVAIHGQPILKMAELNPQTVYPIHRVIALGTSFQNQ